MNIVIAAVCALVAISFSAGSQEPVVNLDKLTYAGSLEKTSSLQGDERHTFVQGDIGDRALAEHQPRAPEFDTK